MNPQRSGSPFIYALLILTMILWGGTWISGKLLANSVTPMVASFLRFLSSSVFMIAMLRHREGHLPKLPLKYVPHVAFLGATGVFLYSFFFFNGLKTVSAARAGLIIACAPVSIAALAALLFRERFGFGRIIGALISLSGVAAVLSGGNPLDLLHEGVGTGELFILGCVGSWSAYTLGGRQTLKHLDPLTAVCWSSIFGTLFLSVPAAMDGLWTQAINASWVDWASILYLGIPATGLAYSWYYRGIAEIGPARAGIFINLVPVFTIILAVFILGEAVTPSLLLGGAMVITGVTVVNRC